MHSLGDVWHLGSEDLESLPGSLLCRIWRIWSLWGPWGPTVSLAALFLPIFMLSLGDVWHLGSEDLESLQVLGPCYLSAFLRAVSGALGGPQCHLLQGSGVSAGSGSLLCRIWRVWSLWGPVSLAALFLPIFMHSLGDVWHLGSEDLESLQVLGPCYLYAFLRWRLASWLWGSGVSVWVPALQDLLCRIWSLWGPVSLAALFLPIFMHSFGDVWHLGSEDLESLQVLGPCYLSAFLRSVSGALGGPQCHLLQGSGVSAGSGSLLCRIWRIWSLWGPVSLAALFLPIFMHSLGQSLGPLGVHSVTCCKDLGSLQVLGPCSAGSGGSGVSGAQCHLLHSFFLSLYAFLRWRLASWLWGSGVSAASGSLLSLCIP